MDRLLKRLRKGMGLGYGRKKGRIGGLVCSWGSFVVGNGWWVHFWKYRWC